MLHDPKIAKDITKRGKNSFSDIITKTNHIGKNIFFELAKINFYDLYPNCIGLEIIKVNCVAGTKRRKGRRLHKTKAFIKRVPKMHIIDKIQGQDRQTRDTNFAKVSIIDKFPE
jgi:hypothetical protein